MMQMMLMMMIGVMLLLKLIHQTGQIVARLTRTLRRHIRRVRTVREAIRRDRMTAGGPTATTRGAARATLRVIHATACPVGFFSGNACVFDRHLSLE